MGFKFIHYLPFCILFVLQSCTCSHQDEQLMVEGISKDLATHRKEQISNLTYALSFNIPAADTAAIEASETCTFDLSQVKGDLIFDFQVDTSFVRSITINGQKIKVRFKNGHFSIAENHLKEGNNQVDIQFIAGEQSLNRNPDYLYTLLVPARASTLFPCFDQPDLKAVYKLKLEVPADWEVLAGGRAAQQNTAGPGRHTYSFAPTKPISTYLFSFVAGKFSVYQQQEMRMLFRENNPAKLKQSLDSIIIIHQNAIDYLEAYTAYPFPFSKLDMACIPGFQYGGMEHVGAIQYRESTLFLDKNATPSQSLRRAKLIAHETAHMWFGDLVTMKWFDDVWMKEVFANFMADKIVNPQYPDINHDLNFFLLHYPSAYSEDRTLGNTPIQQDLQNLKDAGSVYGNIIYDKAPIMMRQLEKTLGKELFQEAVQEYLKTFAYENATWQDLVEILDGKTKLDIKQWSKVWVNDKGRPVFEGKLDFDREGKITEFSISQRPENGPARIWPQSFQVTLVYPDKNLVLDVNSNEQTVQIPKAVGLLKPIDILYNSDGYGYGVFPVMKDPKTMPLISNELARAAAYVNAYEQTLRGKLSRETHFETLKMGLKSEKNELILNEISGQLQNTFWAFPDVNFRNMQASLLIPIYIELLERNSPDNLKKVYFHLLKNTAYTSSGQEKLWAIWSGDVSYQNLKLNDDNYRQLAEMLLLYDHPQRKVLIEKTKKSIKNPDELARFEYLLPALSASAQDRENYIHSLAKAENREKESWVLDGLAYVHHPLRQHASLKYLKQSLDLLSEVQRTGDIFFPKAWLENGIGQYHSAEAYQVLEDFLNAHPDYPQNLKNKLLQASDNLRRSAVASEKGE